MFILNIIPAPSPRKAISYDIKTNELIIEKADVIALVELQNPDNPQEMATIPMFMCSDSYGVYSAPQVNMGFLEFVEPHENIDLGKYTDQIKEIKKLYNSVKDGLEEVEVENKGNVTHIKRIIRNKKKDLPKNEN